MQHINTDYLVVGAATVLWRELDTTITVQYRRQSDLEVRPQSTGVSASVSVACLWARLSAHQ